jgi:hypothetical protein
MSAPKEGLTSFLNKSVPMNELASFFGDLAAY